MRYPAANVATIGAHTRDDLARLAVSGIVAAILGAQLLVGFSYHGGQTFPIVSYPMFSQAHHAGDRLNDGLLYRSIDGGPPQVIDPEAAEISFALYQASISRPMIRGETPALVARFAREACAAGPARSVTLTLYDSGYTLQREGPVSDGKKLMGSVTYACSAF